LKSAFAQDGIAGVATGNGLFFGGGLSLLGKQALGVVSVGGFVFAGSIIIWLLIKKTIGIRVSLKEEIEGLDIGEHGNQAYPEFVSRRMSYIIQSGHEGIDNR
jgi:Amt family ammonium transporter